MCRMRKRRRDPKLRSTLVKRLFSRVNSSRAAHFLSSPGRMDNSFESTARTRKFCSFPISAGKILSWLPTNRSSWRLVRAPMTPGRVDKFACDKFNTLNEENCSNKLRSHKLPTPSLHRNRVTCCRLSALQILKPKEVLIVPARSRRSSTDCNGGRVALISKPSWTSWCAEAALTTPQNAWDFSGGVSCTAIRSSTTSGSLAAAVIFWRISDSVSEESQLTWTESLLRAPPRALTGL